MPIALESPAALGLAAWSDDVIDTCRAGCGAWRQSFPYGPVVISRRTSEDNWGAMRNGGNWSAG